MPENAGVPEGQEGRGLLLESPGTDADLLVSFARLICFVLLGLICDLCIQYNIALLRSVLDLNAFERQNKAEGLGMVSEEGTSKSRAGLSADVILLETIGAQIISRKCLNNVVFR